MSGKRRKRKDKSGDDSNSAPGWMTTYGDLMSLLLAFFILIVSFSSIQDSEFKKAIGSLQRALGLLPANVSVYGPPTTTIPPRKRREVHKAIRKMLKEIEGTPRLKENIALEKTKDGIRMAINNPLLFDVGRANIKPDIFPILEKVAAVLDSGDYEIVVEGHTDDTPISNEKFRSNWELSAARSVAVVEYFVRQGIEPERFRAVGFSEYRPLASNITEEGRAKNRRVVIYLPAHVELLETSSAGGM